ncbi:hypothetical protein [Chitinophaga sp. S165]|uniref:hypothetical protein n=1 Tax=Chitinophaga sp. S165 TaxID=2135462 RepID=UPI000D7182C4|nr:hypothetical protein [Chitinophaga sp. S165]PWV55715.1 hypothetical protein C7475_101221 [Chitinophaga sp. S165]
MRLFVVLLLCCSVFTTQAQNDTLSSGELKKYIGKYDVNGMVVQLVSLKQSLMLVVPGAPMQEMIPDGVNKFKTSSFEDERFLFVEKDGKTTAMISQRGEQSLEFRKISDTADNFAGTDSLLTLRKLTAHFILLYSSIDAASVNSIADRLEGDYKRVLNDFKLDKMPVTTVRIYPNREGFKHGINFPNAPDEVLATAFGKDDFRMVSPNAEGVDSAMLTKGVTHEFTHCVHLNIDYSPNNPRWLWEGVAMFESDWFFDPKELDIIRNKQFPPLATLGNGMEYMLGYVIIEAIRDIWGFDAVISLIKTRGNVASSVSISENEFEKSIFEHIYSKYVKKD